MQRGGGGGGEGGILYMLIHFPMGTLPSLAQKGGGGGGYVAEITPPRSTYDLVLQNQPSYYDLELNF